MILQSERLLAHVRGWSGGARVARSEATAWVSPSGRGEDGVLGCG